MLLGLKTVIWLEKWILWISKTIKTEMASLVDKAGNKCIKACGLCVWESLEQHRCISNGTQSEQDNNMRFLC